MAYTSSLVEEFENLVLDKHSVDWLSLPEDIYSLIANKVIHIRDYTRFGAVCTLWQRVYARNRNNLIREPLLLMVPTEHDQDGQSRSLYSLYENKIYKNLKVPLPHNRHCCGSSHGWLVTVSENYDVSLVNPFLPPSTEIQLPSLTEFHREPICNDPIHGPTFLRKAVLSADPISNPNYVVMAIHGIRTRISIFKPGDKTWTLLQAESIFDIIYDQNKFYALHVNGNVLECDVNGPCAEIKSLGEVKDFYRREESRYLVKSSTDLLQVLRDVRDDLYDESDDSDQEPEDNRNPLPEYSFTTDYRTIGFKVLKFDPKLQHWKSVKSLDGKVLFVGDHSSLCLSVSDMPGCKPNCIYFTDDNHTAYFRVDNFEPRDVGVYCMEHERCRPFYPSDSKTFAVTPIFIQHATQNLSCSFWPTRRVSF